MALKPTATTLVIKKSTDDKDAVCDGGGVLGHPLVYLPFGNKLQVVCYYCGRCFEIEKNNLKTKD